MSTIPSLPTGPSTWEVSGTPTSPYVELKKARKPSNPLAIGLDWIICDRNSVSILKHSPISCGDVARAVGRDLRASKRMEEPWQEKRKVISGN